MRSPEREKTYSCPTLNLARKDDTYKSEPHTRTQTHTRAQTHTNTNTRAHTQTLIHSTQRTHICFILNIENTNKRPIFNFQCLWSYMYVLGASCSYLAITRRTGCSETIAQLEGQ